MSSVLRMLQAFPRGRTTEEILVLVGASFSHDKRVATLTEVDQLLADGHIEKAKTGRWKAKSSSPVALTAAPNSTNFLGSAEHPQFLNASAAEFHASQLETLPDEEADSGVYQPIEHKKLLQYWRATLRADPRGATTQVVDTHGLEWQLISGRGPMVPGAGETLEITIRFDALSPTFQEALTRREGNENTLAVGWPLAVGRKTGVPIVQPIGMLTASWMRDSDSLRLAIESDDILVNPEWIKAAARLSGWRKEALTELLSSESGLGLRSGDFRENLRTAIARQIKGNLTGEDLASHLDPEAPGIYDACALFLPSDSSFTVGAARDLDAISDWSKERLQHTALGVALQLGNGNADETVHAINALELNKEQLVAVQHALSTGISVVTGPPGTGKSQAIVSMAGSVLAAGGSVLVASKNHQALDAVEDRLGELASEVPFITRTLDPKRDLDVDFTASFKSLLGQDSAIPFATLDEIAVEELRALSNRRKIAIDGGDTSQMLELQIAELLDRIALREARNRAETDMPLELTLRQKFWRRITDWVNSLFAGRRAGQVLKSADTHNGKTLSQLQQDLAKLRAKKGNIGPIEDPISLGLEIKALAERLMPKIIARNTFLPEVERQDLAERFENWQFSDGKGQPPGDISRRLVAYRPLWLASVLGTPKRIPLDDGLFDLVIFDEASQCDIATAIPLFARAKRAVIVGDDRQLSFIAGLGQAQDRNLMQAQGLPVQNMGRFAQSRQSLFNFASRLPNAKRVTLRQQYRSAGPIVDYINEAFYGGVLSVAYDPKRLVLPKNTKPGIAWENVPAPAIPQIGNVNTAEIEAITRHLIKLLNEQGYQGSVGVITPFRSQVMALETAINGAISPPVREAVELRVGTVDGFQGQERDLIMFSPCVGPRSPQSGLTFFQRDTRRLNVAISRARAVAMVFGDLDFARSGRIKALTRLAAKATEPRPKSGEAVFDSDWERRVFYALQKAGLDPKPQYEIAGRRLDFALFGATGTKLDLEVDGRRWHEGPDGRRKSSDLWRDAQLKSMSWKVRRFWVDELANDMEKCIDLVKQDLA